MTIIIVCGCTQNVLKKLGIKEPNICIVLLQKILICVLRFYHRIKLYQDPKYKI